MIRITDILRPERVVELDTTVKDTALAQLCAVLADLPEVRNPARLLRAIRDIRVGREIEPYIGFTTSLALGMVIVVSAFWLSSTSQLPSAAQCPLIVPVSISAVITGLLILVSRRKAVTQVIGYIVLENGVYIFGLSLAAKMPFLVEMGIMLDVLGGVFVMGVAIDQIRDMFDDMDVERLSELKDS